MTREGPSPRHVALVGISRFYLLNFKATLIAALRDAGHRVTCIAPEHPGENNALEAMGIRYRPWSLWPSSTRPLRELRALQELARFLDEDPPDIAFSFTIKPNCYTGLLARTRPWRYVPTLTGLGTVFLEPRPSYRVIRGLLAETLTRADHVFVQNDADAELTRDLLAVPASRVERVPGSGLDVSAFGDLRPPAFPATGASEEHPLMFSYIGRFLGQKGVALFAAAARMLQGESAARFAAIGSDEALNRSAIPVAQLREIGGPGLQFEGWQEDPRQAYARSHFVVLPSYREGLSRTLAEAMACGIPAITTDVPGCRDVVRDGIEGYVVPANDASALAQAMRKALRLSSADYARLSASARMRASDFGSSLVDSRYLLQTHC
jgi:glycosyltransferase involved in cell wall biosynthesis